MRGSMDPTNIGIRPLAAKIEISMIAVKSI